MAKAKKKSLRGTKVKGFKGTARRGLRGTAEEHAVRFKEIARRTGKTLATLKKNLRAGDCRKSRLGVELAAYDLGQLSAEYRWSHKQTGISSYHDKMINAVARGVAAFEKSKCACK